MPTPIVIVDGGVAAVSVRSTCPVAVTENVWYALPPTGTVPVKVSVVRVTVGVGVVVASLLHATVAHVKTATAIARR